METKVFEHNALSVVQRDSKYFVRYDAGAHQEAWREDEISTEDFEQIKSGADGRRNVILSIQKRLGPAAYRSNWNPYSS